MAADKSALTFICLLSAYYAVAEALPSTAAAPSSSPLSCTQMLYYLSDCLEFIKEGSTVKSVSKKCCNGVKIVIPSVTQECVCEAVGLAGKAFNITRAVILPSICHINGSIPSTSSCSGVHPPSPQADSPDGYSLTQSQSPAKPPSGIMSPAPLPGGAYAAAGPLFLYGIVGVGAVVVLFF